MNAYPPKFTYNKSRIPKRIKAEGVVAQKDLTIGAEGDPKAKLLVFKNRTLMRKFYKSVLPALRGGGEEYQNAGLGARCLGFVNQMRVDCYRVPEEGDLEWTRSEVDRRYFCLVGLVEGHLTAEVITHEAVHVGFAWDIRTRGSGPFEDPHNPEENVCYLAGRFVNEVLTVIKEHKLREV